MKRLLSVILTAACVLTMCVSLTACDLLGGNKGDAAAFVSLDINPSLELTLDKNNKVISVYGANEDGQVLLYGEDGIIGADIEVATARILELAKEMGYVDESNTVVQTTVSSDKKGKEDSIYSKINAQVTVSAEKVNLALKCDTNAAYSLARKLERLKAQYPDSQAIQNLTPAKLKLVISATENGEISIEAAAEMNTSELVNYVSETHKQMEEFATEAYKKTKALASATYDEAVGLAVDGVYTAYYIESVLQLKHLDTAYLGALYQSYKMSGRALNAIADGLVYVEKINDYALNAQQIQAVLEALGSDVTADDLKNSDGEVTINSIYAYADKSFKNSQISSDIEAVKEKLNAALNNIDAQLQEVISAAAEKYQPQIEAVSAGINKIIEALPDAVKNAAKNAFDELTAAADSFAEIVKDGKITSDEVRSLAKSMDDKASGVLSKIENDLSAEELEKIADNKQTLLDKASSAKAAMEQEIAKAEQLAKAKLADLKASRTSK